jgi:uncharacterized protein YndB with AHSA1/START domain
MTTTTDRIEKRVLLRAPRARVWRALADSTEFGRWFQVSFTEPFRPGATLAGRITHPGYQHLVMQLTIEEMVDERRFSYRWHPHAVQPGVDYSDEPTTLVTFTLEDAEGGTLLTVVESGFDRIPMARRAEALGANEGGWTEQVKAIEAYLGRTP